jgi:hypothetical protein
MPQTTTRMPVTGTVTTDSDGTMLILAERIDGHDTFLTGELEIDGHGTVNVRILTLDDVTVLRLTAEPASAVVATWSGVLHLPHGWRPRSVPSDLTHAAAVANRHLGALDDAELRYALTFLDEAVTPQIRTGRIDVIVSALPVQAGAEQW